MGPDCAFRAFGIVSAHGIKNSPALLLKGIVMVRCCERDELEPQQSFIKGTQDFYELVVSRRTSKYMVKTAIEKRHLANAATGRLSRIREDSLKLSHMGIFRLVGMPRKEQPFRRIRFEKAAARRGDFPPNDS